MRAHAQLVLKLLKKLLFDPEIQRKKAFLKQLVLFQDLRDRELGVLAQALHARTYREGEVIFLEGDIGRALFIIESGRVELTKADRQGADKSLFTIEPGDFFGEMALLEHIPRSASAAASERSRLLLLYRSKLEMILHYHPRIGVKIMSHMARILSARLRRTTAGAAAPADG